MNRAKLLLMVLLCVASVRQFVGADKVDQDHRDSHHEKNIHQRTKRYLGRVPLSYESLNIPSSRYLPLSDGAEYAMERSARTFRTNPVASHFRELGRQEKRRSSSNLENDGISPELLAYRNLQQYYGGGGGYGNIEEEPLGFESPQPEMPLTDDDLQTLLLLLDGYKMQGKSARNYYPPQAQYFDGDMQDVSVGKRETGKRDRGQLGLEQPMSFENSLGDSYPVFLNSKRSKRIGTPMHKAPSSVRIKKETDPAVEASLDKLFGDHIIHHQSEAQQHQSTSIPTTAVSSSDQIPAPARTQLKSKKAINWSDYFGVDKKQDRKSTEVKHPPAAGPAANSLVNSDNNHQHEEAHEQVHDKPEEAKKEKAITSTSSNPESVVAPAVQNSNDKSDQLKEKKGKDQLENDVGDKPDRNWILKEFYKNLAMSTSVKRKRESSGQGKLNKLEKLEKQMGEAGDQIIWDTLKYTGAHRDAELSPEELAQVKNAIIQKLTTAYSLEKMREAIEEFRQRLAQLKDKQQYY